MTLAAIPWILSAVIAITGGMGWLVATARKKKIETVESERDEAKRAQALAESDTEDLMNYIAKREEVKEIQAEDVRLLLSAKGAQKHAVVSNALDRLYSNSPAGMSNDRKDGNS